MSSVHDTIPWAGHVNYAASKGGDAADEEHRAGGGAVPHPGERDRPRCDQDAHQPGGLGDAEAYADLMRLIPYKRIGEPEDIARAAVWLASDEADYLTGTTLYVDGGMTLYPGFEAGLGTMAGSMGTLARHWPEYLMEAWGLGTFHGLGGLVHGAGDPPGLAAGHARPPPPARLIGSLWVSPPWASSIRPGAGSRAPI